MKLHIRMQKAKNMGLTTSCDPQWDPVDKWKNKLENIWSIVGLLLPNETELKCIPGLTDWKTLT